MECDVAMFVPLEGFNAFWEGRDGSSSARRLAGDLVMAGSYLLALGSCVLAIAFQDYWLFSVGTVSVCVGSVAAVSCWSAPFDSNMIAEKLVATLPSTAMRAPVADTGVANNVQESVGQPPFTLLSDSSTEELVK